MRRVDYDHLQHRGYEEGRRLSPETRRLWMDAVGECLSGLRVDRILDLGAGTGRFSDALAGGIGAAVVSLDPSREMLREAAVHHRAEGVHLVAGAAEAIPLPSASVDAAFLSMVLHHLDDVGAAARELARVVRPGGRVLIRNAFRGRLDFPFYEYFPEAKGIDEARMPSVGETEARLAGVGFTLRAHRVVRQTIDKSLRAHSERIRKGAISTLELVSEAERRAGLARLEEAARAETDPQPVREGVDLLVFGRG